MSRLKKPTTRILAKLLSTLAMVAVTQVVAAADYPNKPVTIIVPFPAGGSTDLMARAVAQEFTKTLGQNVVITNTAGGAGTVGTMAVARARADGYTLGVVPAAPLVNQPHMRKTPYTLESFDYVCQLFNSPLALAIKPDSPFNTLQELVVYAKANPNKLTYGTPGPGTLPHLAMEQLLDKAGISAKHVPFQGDAPAATALVGGHTDLYVGPVNVIKNKDMRSIAVFTEERLDVLPNTGTAKEQGVDMTAAWWGGVLAPKGTPPEVIALLEKSCVAASQSETFKTTLSNLGTMIRYRDAKNYRKLVDEVSAINAVLIAKVLKAPAAAKK
jgi:tripartite-type tricarboxylate transporter receptor subunit TctC